MGLSLVEAIREEVVGTKTVSLTGIKPIDKIIMTVIGVVGMGSIALIAAVGLYKMPPLSTMSRGKGYKSVKRMTKGLKVLWDMAEPVLRTWKPSLKEKFYYVDQAFDFVQAFMDKEEIGSLFREDSSGY